jgi:hypothetical protein
VTAAVLEPTRYIMAGSAEEAKHRIYVWDGANFDWIKTLEPPEEKRLGGLLHVEWHPARPIIASTSTDGVV